MTRTGGFSLKITIAICALFLASVLILALGFNFVAGESARALRETLGPGSDALQREKAAVLIDRLKSEPVFTARDLAARLRVHARADDGFLFAIIYARTQDENFFELAESVSINNSFRVQLPESRVIREEKDINFLRRGLVGAVTDPEVRRTDGTYWQAVYAPLPLMGKTHVIQLFVSVSGQYARFEDYSGRIAAARVSVAAAAALIALVLAAAGWLLAHNYSILVRGLSSSMTRAAQGDLSISLKPTSDTELAALAQSFNTLIGEMRGLREIRDRDNAPAEEPPPREELRAAAHDAPAVEPRADAPVTVRESAPDAAPVIPKPDVRDVPGDAARDVPADVPQFDPSDEIFRQGVSLLKENRTADAIDIFRALIVLNPGSFGSLFNLGVAYARTKEYARSAGMFSRSLDAQPEHEIARQYLEKVERLAAGEARGNGPAA